MALITLDFETYYGKDYTLSKMTTEAYIRDPRFQTIGFGFRVEDGPAEWVTGTSEYIERRLRELELERHRVVCHHAAFDCGILAYRYNIRPGFMYDTLSMARPLITDAKAGGSLDKLSQRFMLGEKGKEVIAARDKRRHDFTPAELAQYGEYCKNDVNLTYALFHVLQHYSTPEECYMIDMLLRMYTDPTIMLGRSVLEQHLAEVKARKDALMAEIDSTIGRGALMSNQQFAKVLEDLGVEPPMKTNAKGKMTYAFSKKDVEFNDLLEHDDERVQTVVAARLGVKSTQEETRCERFLSIESRGAMPVPLSYYAAHTGRAGGWDKINLQNLPRGGNLRKSLQAPPGHIMVACDSSQIEARITAWLAGQTDLVEAFANGDDIYSKFASIVYGRPINRKRKEIGPDGKEFAPDFAPGFVGKTAILGLGFGMGKDNFKRTLKIGQGGFTLDMDIDECERTVNIYRKQYTKIPKLWEAADQALHAMAHGNEFELGVGIRLKCDYRGIHLPNGMIQRYEDLAYRKADGDKYRRDGWYYKSKYGPKIIYGAKLVENVVQALARIVVFNQMAKIDQQMKKYDRKLNPDARFKVILTVHDEVVCICPISAADKVEAMMVNIMSKPPSWGPDLPIACEAGRGFNYGDAK